MRIACPICGERDRREFAIKGDAVALLRPSPEAPDGAWDEYLNLRDNPAGPLRELWYHAQGCSAWLVVTRDTVTHAVTAVELASACAEDRS